MPLITLPNAFGDTVTNMAIDAALLGTLPDGIAVFRHYGWTEPALTFGYTQKHVAVKNIAPPGVTLCRRLTGGGIVDHRDDWTYALILHRAIPAARIAANTFYEKLHRCIQRALEAQLIENRLAPCPKKCGQTAAPTPGVPAQCFVTPAASDVLLPGGRKIAGAAMKRSRDGLLVQGSIDRATLPPDFNYEHFSRTLIKQLSIALQIPAGTAEDLRSLFNASRIEAERQRFTGDAWNHKR